MVTKCQKCGKKLVDYRSKYFIKCAYLGDRNNQWKGNKVGLDSLHEWIGNRKPKPEFCEYCNKVPPFDLANISGKYLRDIYDFKWLRRSCHMKSDGRLKKLINSSKESRKRKHQGDLLYCNKCKIFKNKEDFTKNRAIYDRYELFCRECLSVRTKNYYKKRKLKCQIK